MDRQNQSLMQGFKPYLVIRNVQT